MTILEHFKKNGDWRCAFQEAFNGCYSSDDQRDDHPIEQVVEVIAAADGTHDEEDWVCVVQLKDGRFAKVFAGCDYTGWD